MDIAIWDQKDVDVKTAMIFTQLINDNNNNPQNN